MQADALGVKPQEQGALLTARLGPELNVSFEEIVFSNLPSPQMSLEKWLELAVAINTALNGAQSSQILGAVVLHGTDLLPECAQTLHLCLNVEKPVVITGSMRAQGEQGYDGLRNLENAARICLALPGAGVVLACMGDEIFSALNVFKQNSVAPASMAAEDGLLGRIAGQKAVFFRKELTDWAKGAEAAAQAAQPVCCQPPRSKQHNPACFRRPLFNPQSLLERGLPPAGLICARPGDDGLLVDLLLQSGIQGLVVEGFGAGNLPPLLARKLKAALAADLPVLLTTRCPRGGVHPIYAYEGGAKDLQEAGAILCAQTTSSKALIFLQMALASQFSKSQLKDFFEQYDC